jgi:hypothetical protein
MEVRTVSLQRDGISTLWEALRAEGYTTSELLAAPEILAWAAERNGLPGFRRILPGRELDLPRYTAKAEIVATVREAPARYDAALGLVRADIALSTLQLEAPAGTPIAQREVPGVPLMSARLGVPATSRPFSSEILSRVAYGSGGDTFTKDHEGKTLSFRWSHGYASLDGRVIASGSAVYEWRSEFNEYGDRDWNSTLEFAPAGNVGPFISFLRHETGALGNAVGPIASSVAETHRHNGDAVAIGELLSLVEVAQIKRAIVAELRRIAPRFTADLLDETVGTSFAVFAEGRALRFVVVVPAHVYTGNYDDGRVAEFVFDVTTSAKLRAALGS